jgi:hypothetical protein
MPLLEWPEDVHVFNGFVQFNRICIKGYVHVMDPIFWLICKIEEFD